MSLTSHTAASVTQTVVTQHTAVLHRFPPTDRQQLQQRLRVIFILISSRLKILPLFGKWNVSSCFFNASVSHSVVFGTEVSTVRRHGFQMCESDVEQNNVIVGGQQHMHVFCCGGVGCVQPTGLRQ